MVCSYVDHNVCIEKDVYILICITMLDRFEGNADSFLLLVEVIGWTNWPFCVFASWFGAFYLIFSCSLSYKEKPQ